MAICCCSMAGTAACQYCNNNPYAKPSPYRTVTTVSTGGDFKGFGDVFAYTKPVKKCETCVFFVCPAEDTVPNAGECHIHPPIVTENGKTRFPCMWKSDFCGGWKEKA